MVDWTSPASLMAQAMAIDRLGLIFFGIFAWEYIQTLWFEWWLVTRKIAFKWPYVSYFIGRYSTLVTLICVVSTKLNPTSRTSCIIFGEVLSVLGDLTVGAASFNLMIRAFYMARLHRRFRLLAKGLVIVGFGQWLVLGYGIVMMKLNFRFDGVCAASPMLQRAISIVYLYTVIYDFLILLLSIVTILALDRSGSPLKQVLIKQGVGYFVVALIANVLPAAFALLGQSDLMIVATSIPGYTMSTVASCRAVTSLISWRSNATHTSVNVDVERSGSRPGLQLTTNVPLPLPTESSSYELRSPHEKYGVRSKSAPFSYTLSTLSSEVTPRPANGIQTIPRSYVASGGSGDPAEKD